MGFLLSNDEFLGRKASLVGMFFLDREFERLKTGTVYVSLDIFQIEFEFFTVNLL
jgi:hypothetical protein